MRQIGMLAFLLVWSSAVASAGETPVKSRIISAGLFKNGLAVISRTVSVPADGTYRLDDVPEPIHGTYWIVSDAKVVTRLTHRMVEVPADEAGPVNLQEELAGRNVVIYFTDGGIPPASGRVAELVPKPKRYETARYGYGTAAIQPPGGGRFLILEKGKDRSYIDSSKIAYLQAEGAGAKIMRRKPVMLFEVSGLGRKNATINISYLTRGIAWAPSYRLDLSDPKQLVLQQKAIIKNELVDLADTRLELISGFPNIEFQQVTSPLTLASSWQDFFNQLSSSTRSLAHVSMGNRAITQQAVRFNEPAPGSGLDLSAIPTGDRVDLYYQDIGPYDLLRGESLAVQTAMARASYNRIVEWNVPDNRGQYGSYSNREDANRDAEKFDDTAWDAIRFRNPLSFPMTTAPAVVVDGEHFNGQRLSYWVNRGEMTTLRVTKALSIRTLHTEKEVKGNRKDLYIGGDRYYRATVESELRANNHRSQEVSMVIRRRFSGKLVRADRKPKCTLGQEGVFSVNHSNECAWNLKLKPGQDVKIKYRYTVLVRY